MTTLLNGLKLQYNDFSFFIALEPYTKMPPGYLNYITIRIYIRKKILSMILLVVSIFGYLKPKWFRIRFVSCQPAPRSNMGCFKNRLDPLVYHTSAPLFVLRPSWRTMYMSAMGLIIKLTFSWILASIMKVWLIILKILWNLSWFVKAMSDPTLSSGTTSISKSYLSCGEYQSDGVASHLY